MFVLVDFGLKARRTATVLGARDTEAMTWISVDGQARAYILGEREPLHNQDRRVDSDALASARVPTN